MTSLSLFFAVVLIGQETVPPDMSFSVASGAAREALDRAIGHFTEAIRLDPKSTLAYSHRGHAFYLKGDFRSAAKDCTDILKLEPWSTDAYQRRGNARYAVGNYEEAIADYGMAIRCSPNSVSAYFWRAMAYTEKGRYDSAIDDYTTAIRIYPQYGSAYYQRGLIFLNKGDYDRIFVAYPDIPVPHLPSISPLDTTIAPGQTVVGTFVSAFKMSQQQWDARKSLDFSFDFRYQAPLVVTPHVAITER